MVISPLTRKLFSDLKTLRAQTATISVLVICGVSLLVAAWSAYWSLTLAQDSYYRHYSFADVFVDLTAGPRDLIPTLKSLPGVAEAEGRLVLEGLLELPGRSQPALGRMISVPDRRQPALNQIHLRKGRLPESASMPEIVLHEGFATANRVEVGDQLKLVVRGQQETLQVVGVGISPEYIYALSPASPLPDDQNFGVGWMTLASLERLSRMKGEVNNITLKLTDPTQSREVINAVDEKLKSVGGRGAYDRSRQLSHLFTTDEIKEQRVTAIYSPLIFLSVAAFLIHVVISRLIASHRSQIATLKAVGYRDREVAFHYLGLVALMLILGAGLGVGVGGMLGQGLSKAYEGFFRFPQLSFSLSWGSVVVGLVAGLLPGLLGALKSVWQVFRLSPAEGMRPPAPTQFHQGRLERTWIFKRMRNPNKILFRSLLSNYPRVLLSIVGMSVALSIVVMAGGWKDLIDFLMETQFQKIQREDLSVDFLTPITPASLSEIGRLDGVLQSEGYRHIPIRLKSEQHKREVLLTGWPAHPKLRQKLNRSLEPISPPTTGLMLSSYFRDRWGLKAGDTVQIELLDRASQPLPLTVAGFSDDLMGLSATLPLAETWGLAREEPSFNQVLVRADPHQIHSLYLRLKSAPHVSAVTLKSSIYQGFNQSFGKILVISMAILVVFALAIILGVIYNTVRVSFAERAWEFASLRVLGFSEFSVFHLLLNEVLVQISLCLLPGCLMGYLLMKGLLGAVQSEVFAFPLVIEPRTYALSVFSLMLALLVSMVVVKSILRNLNLVDALKSRD